MLESPETSPPADSGISMVYDFADRQVVMLSSVDGGTWIWDGTNWTRESPKTSPPLRDGYAMAYDAAHGQIVLFGGGGASDVVLGDTWVWDGVNWTQQFPQTSPLPRAGAAMAYDAAHSQMVLFGGHAVIGPDLVDTTFGDTWVWDGVNWTKQSPMASPPARSGAGIAYESAHGLVVLFGGLPTVFPTSATSPTAFNDTWAWDGANWAKESPRNKPPASSDFAVAYDSTHNQTVLFGGLSAATPGFAPQITLDTFWAFTLAGVAKPVLSSAGTLSEFGGFAGVAPGSWVEIYGANFTAGPLGWSASNFNGNDAPSSLGGVQVSAGGQNAFVQYVSAGQVNAQLPLGIAAGVSQIAVTNANGSSDPYYVTIDATQAGLLAPPSFNIGGKQYVVGVLSDGSYALPSGSISGVASRPAQPGETMILYGIGFGPVTPSLDAGVIETQLNQLTTPLEMFFGGTQAQLSYFGLSPGYVGLYQFNVVVPVMAASDLVPLTFHLDGAAGSQKLYTAIGF